MLNHRLPLMLSVTALLLGCSEPQPPTQTSTAAQPAEERVSAPGVYQGYSEAVYAEWVLESLYVPVRDGTQLAVTLYHPAQDGVAVDTPYPVVFSFTPYRGRYHTPGGAIVASAETGRAPLVNLTRYGYVVATVDIRGKGASFGHRRGFQDRTEAQDAYDIIEWLGAQPWSTGNVGMWGCSYVGGTQLQAATVAPPSLKAIFTGGSDYDKYNFVSRGGITAQFNPRPDEDPEVDLATVPMQQDADGSMLRAAVAEHAASTPMAELWYGMPYRDSVSPLLQVPFWEEVGVYNYADTIRAADLAIYHWHNWTDEGSAEGFAAAANLDNPGRMLVGPGGHCAPAPDFDLSAEQLRYYDHYLKGIDNGFDEDPYYTLSVIDAPESQQWLHTDRWPLPDERRVPLLLGPQGTLSHQAEGVSTVSFQVDYDVTCPGDEYFFFWPCSMAGHGLSFELPVLSEPVTIAGHPVVRLQVSADTDDFDLFGYLEEVNARGETRILSHGRLRASHHAEAEPPYDYLGLPWHSGLSSDVAAVEPGTLIEMAFDFLPTLKYVPAGHQLRLVLAGADPRQRNLPEIRRDPAPTVTVYLGAEGSLLELPVLGDDASELLQQLP